MDQVTLAKNHMRAENWSKLIQACQQSGQTVVSWCEQNNVNSKTYYYWLCKLRTQELDGKELPVPVQEEKPVVFEQLEVQTMKVLLWEGDGFVLLYKRLENGRFQWPRSEAKLKPISWQQFCWLVEGPL